MLALDDLAQTGRHVTHLGQHVLARELLPPHRHLASADEHADLQLVGNARGLVGVELERAQPESERDQLELGIAGALQLAQVLDVVEIAWFQIFWSGELTWITTRSLREGVCARATSAAARAAPAAVRRASRRFVFRSQTVLPLRSVALNAGAGWPTEAMARAAPAARLSADAQIQFFLAGLLVLRSAKPLT